MNDPLLVKFMYCVLSLCYGRGSFYSMIRTGTSVIVQYTFIYTVGSRLPPLCSRSSAFNYKLLSGWIYLAGTYNLSYKKVYFECFPYLESAFYNYKMYIWLAGLLQGTNARKFISEVYASFVLQCIVSGR